MVHRFSKGFSVSKMDLSNRTKAECRNRFVTSPLELYQIFDTMDIDSVAGLPDRLRDEQGVVLYGNPGS